MYKVLKAFVDLQDDEYLYKKDDEYPRKGYSPSKERVNELATNKNRLHKPLIKAIKGTEVVGEVVQQVVQQEEKPQEESQTAAPKKRGRNKK